MMCTRTIATNGRAGVSPVVGRLSAGLYAVGYGKARQRSRLRCVEHARSRKLVASRSRH
jgi:hypothetical protein